MNSRRLKTSPIYRMAIVAITFLPSIASSQEAITPLSLQDCVKMGIEQNFSILIEQHRSSIAAENATIGNAGYLPKLEATSGYTGQRNKVSTFQGSVEEALVQDGVGGSQTSARLNLTWTLFDGFSIQATYARLQELRKMGAINLRMTVENSVAAIAAEYFGLIRQELRLNNLNAALDLSRERMRIVEERYRIGVSSRLEYQQAQVDYNADNSNVIRQHEVVFRSKVNLNELMAIESINDPISLIDTVIPLYPLPDADLLWERISANNVNLLAMESEVSIATLNQRIARSRNYPILRLNSSYGYSSNRFDQAGLTQRDQLGLSYGATLGYPLFDGLNRRREQRNAKTQISISQLQHQQLELGLKADHANLWTAYQNNLTLFEMEQQNLKTAKEYYAIAMDRYKLGDLSGIELREAQNRLLDSEERLLVAQYSVKLCEISLMQLSGDLLDYIWSES